jgi:hypothetical protein
MGSQDVDFSMTNRTVPNKDATQPTFDTRLKSSTPLNHYTPFNKDNDEPERPTLMLNIQSTDNLNLLITK